ncbi:MAG: hypothetical protein LBM87_01225 [Ruminococcus sp.]|jgi:hypothetical protein|nr:hypothetical protein [Ruminococcus sp.]
MKKKILTICIASAVFTLLCACQPTNETTPANAPSVITTASTFAEKTEPTENQTVPETTTEATTTEATTTETTTTETTTISETATTTVPAEELIDSNMPNPFPEGSDDNVSYYQPGNHILDNVTVSLLRLVDDTEQIEWMESFDFFNNPPSSLTEYLNLYSFIKKFDISDEEVIEAMSAHLTSDNPQTKVTEEELDLILHGSEADIVSYFASDYSIVVGDKIYSPHWIYTHTPAAYKEAGITPEALQQKLNLYADMRLTPEALSALEQKIYSYTKSIT